LQLTGYANKISVGPEDRIRFMVSTDLPDYEATIVRLLHGDPSPSGPGFLEQALESNVNGRYEGRFQPIHPGSYVHVATRQHLQSLESLTVQTWIFPTSPNLGRYQGIITAMAHDGAKGFALGLDESGALQFAIGGEAGPLVVTSGIAVRGREWYFVAATYDANVGMTIMVQHPLKPLPEDATDLVVTKDQISAIVATDGPLILGAGTPPPLVSRHFNGKIDSPKVFDRALVESELVNLRDSVNPGLAASDALVAAWDPWRELDTDRFVDSGPGGLHGTTINMPTRGVTGRNWTGREVDWRYAPDEYAAIHFHDDDLDDSRWEPDFELLIPESWTSGIYAARLRSGVSEEYIPFVVRPREKDAPAAVAVLLPTITYQAYANHRSANLLDSVDPFELLGKPAILDPSDHFLREHPEFGMSLYDVHTDGGGCCYSSRLRPILNMRPKHHAWATGARHLRADLCLIDWLEHEKIPYVVFSDEDLHHGGHDLVAPYATLITGSHPEYWTASMLYALDEYLNRGGHLMYLGGNGFYWVTSVDPARPHMIEVRRGNSGSRAWESLPGEGRHSTTGELGGLWRHRGRTPQSLVGVGFTAMGWDRSSSYTRTKESYDDEVAFIFEGVEEETIGDFGLIMGGAVGDELDRSDPLLGTPANTWVLATSSGQHSDFYQHVVEEVLENQAHQSQGGLANPRVRADMVYFETPAGGAVFSVGSIAWVGSLSYNQYDNNVSRITGNVLRSFLGRRRNNSREKTVETDVQPN
jgi:N,N-dimethylformamidase